MYPEVKLNTEYGEITVGVTDRNHAYVSGNLTFRHRLFNLSGHFIDEGSGWQWQESRYGSRGVSFTDANGDAPPSFRAKMKDSVYNAWVGHLLEDDTIVYQGALAALTRSLDSARSKVEEVRKDLQNAEAEVVRLEGEIAKLTS